MIRKTKIPVKTVPEPVTWLLNNATGQQLDFLNRLSSDPDFPANKSSLIKGMDTQDYKK